MASPEKSKYDMRGAQFSGGFAETVNGNQVSSITNNHVEVLGSDEHRHELVEPQVKAFNKSQKYTKRLIALGTAIAALISGATAFSGNLNELFDNIIELSRKTSLSEKSSDK